MSVTQPRSDSAGFWESVGLSGGGSLINQVRQGFSFQIFEAALVRFGFSKPEAAGALGVSRTTLERRARDGQFTTQESDRLYRLVQVLETAESVFEGDTENMGRWMRLPVRALGDRRPIDMIQTSVECEMVLRVLRHIESGDFS